jgi:hypothetical protein
VNLAAPMTPLYLEPYKSNKQYLVEARKRYRTEGMCWLRPKEVNDQLYQFAPMASAANKNSHAKTSQLASESDAGKQYLVASII